MDPSLQLKEGAELSFQQTGSPSVLTQLPSILQSLSTSCNAILGGSDEQKKSVSSWIEKLTSSAGKDEKLLKELDDHLQPRTFIGGHSMSAADIVAYTHLHPYISSATHQDLLKHPSVTRHFDFIQHHSSIRNALGGNLSTELPLVAIDVSNVPEPERKPIAAEKKIKASKNPNAGVTPESMKSSAPIQNDRPIGSEKQKAGPDKKEKKKDGGGDGKKATPAAAGPPMPHMIDMRIGKIIHVEKHPDADSLYVEKIDFGEPEPRTVVSGLVNYIPIEEMRDRLLVGICNLKPANMRGVKSFAMVLAATSKDGKGGSGSVELVAPPPGSQPGDRVYFEGFEDHLPVEQLNSKKKQFETIQPNLTTLSTREACWTDPDNDHKPHRIKTSRGVCCAPTFVGASLS